MTTDNITDNSGQLTELLNNPGYSRGGRHTRSRPTERQEER